MRIDNLKIPGKIVEYAISKGLAKELKLMLALKMCSTGWISRKNVISPEFRSLFGCSSPKTVDKHLNKLLELKWVGRDKNGILYPESWKHIELITKTKPSRRFPVSPKELPNYKTFFISILTDLRLRAVKHYHARIARTIKIRKGGRHTGNFAQPMDTGKSANQKFPIYTSLYFGLSNATIGRMANRSKSWGSLTRKQAVAAGYLWSKHRYVELPVPYSKGLRSQVALAYPDEADRFSLIRRGSEVVLRLQRHDEVTSLLESSRRRVSRSKGRRSLIA